MRMDQKEGRNLCTRTRRPAAAPGKHIYKTSQLPPTLTSASQLPTEPPGGRDREKKARASLFIREKVGPQVGPTPVSLSLRPAPARVQRETDRATLTSPPPTPSTPTPRRLALLFLRGRAGARGVHGRRGRTGCRPSSSSSSTQQRRHNPSPHFSHAIRGKRPQKREARVVRESGEEEGTAGNVNPVMERRQETAWKP